MDQNNSWKNNFKNQLAKVKQPFLHKVDQSKQKFKNIMKNLQDQNNSVTLYQNLIQIIIKKLLEPKTFQKPQQQKNQQIDSESIIKYQCTKRVNSQQSQNNDSHEVCQQLFYAQWKGNDKQRAFKAYEDAVQNYNKIFSKKITTCNTKLNDYSFKTQQKQMFSKIFKQISKNCNQTSFENIIIFFQKCSLFYKIYNLDKEELMELIKSSAHTYPDKLTEQQFSHMFLYNMKDIEDLNCLQSKNNKSCIMTEQNWKDLRHVFAQLDTYGQNKIFIQGFFFKLNNNPCYQQLMSTIAIQYPSLNKYYSLSKIIFDLQNKTQFDQKVTWEQIQEKIFNFQHIDYPTIDQISQQKLKKASISKNFNTFLLKEEVFDILKDQFKKCPKFCNKFVKCKFFCEELLKTEQIKPYFKQYVRKQIKQKKQASINLEKNIRLMFIHGPQYIDLDEMLLFFSVNGFEQVRKNSIRDLFQNNSSTSSQDDFQKIKKIKMKIKRNQSLQKIRLKQSKETAMQKKIVNKSLTKIQPFELSKKQKITIRQKKLSEMLIEKIKKQQAEMRPYIKANPIPPSTTSQRYQQQTMQQQQKKQIKKERINKKYQQYQKRVKYLQANTKLFKKKQTQEDKQLCQFTLNKKQFQSNPTPWYVKQNLLESIENQKQTKRINRIKETQERYLQKYWKNIPYKDKEKKQQLDESLQQQINQIKNALQKNNNKLKSLPVPDFQKLQQQFAFQLQKKKKQFHPTVIKQFNLSSPKALNQNKCGKQASILKIQISKSKDKQNIRSTSLAKSQKLNIGTTKKFQSMVQYNQNKMLQKSIQKSLKQKQEQQRKKKQKIFAKFMEKALRKTKKERSLSQKTIKRKNIQQNNENYLKNIYARVLNRPFLFQQQYKVVRQGSDRKTNSSKLIVNTQRPKKVYIPSESSTFKNNKIEQVESNIQWDQYQQAVDGQQYQQGDQENQQLFNKKNSPCQYTSEIQVNQSF